MATGWPMKVTYANGDVYSASDVNDTNGTINLLGASVAYTAGKSKVINGDFRINQKNFSSSAGSANLFDRFASVVVGNGTSTWTSQTFTPGTAPVTGYEGRNFLQVAISGESSTTGYTIFQQKIESVRTLAGQTATISFWAKANTGTPNILAYAQQQFGTGGSPSAAVTTFGTVTAITTSWVRYSFAITVPSISGKTFGTNNDDFLALNIMVSAGSAVGSPFSSVGVQNNTFQFWGIQIENGSTATAFTTASGGSFQSELAMCQRYYYQAVLNTSDNPYGSAYSSTGATFCLTLPVTMRSTPSASASGTYTAQQPGSGSRTFTGLTNFAYTTRNLAFDMTGSSGLTPGYPLFGTGGTIAISAEL